MSERRAEETHISPLALAFGALIRRWNQGIKFTNRTEQFGSQNMLLLLRQDF
jgi:hypothetical protein